MLNVIVAMKIWATQWTNKRITLYCDNLAVVDVLGSGRTKDTFLATCARNIWLIMSTFNIQVDVIHIPGKNNCIADLLSRWGQTTEPTQKLHSLLPNYKWINTHIDLTLLNVFI